ncbi:MAG: transporter substrate-binding domain-containing protein [Cephaloticoccus sp.]|nr:transporter substrate-binding domain-containing protein [Cephaloticoccus sp.]MCF7759503.1 transporter substrate-binding domain-containing protein [Cephaloticoccus sp.]
MPSVHHLVLWFLCLGLGSISAAPLRIGVESNSPPLSYLDKQGLPTGFTSELLAAMQKTGKVEIEIVPSYWSHILAEFQAGRLDALANVTITAERRATMDYSISHAYVHGLIYVPKGKPALTLTSQFQGKSIGTLRGSIGHLNAQAHDGWGANIVLYDNMQQAFDDVRQGKIDAALLIRGPASAERAETNGLALGFVDDIVHEYHFAVHKGDARTLEQINEALAQVRSNGTFDRIYAKWIGPLEPHPIRLADLKPYFLPATVVILMVLGFVVWQSRIMRQLSRQAAELRASEERWKFALVGSGDGVWDLDCRTNQVIRSKRWKEILGFDEGEIGLDRAEWADRVHPDDLPETLAIQQAHISGQTESFSIEHRLKCKDGSWKWVLNRGMVVNRDKAGNPLRFIGTLSDLTTSKQAEEDRLVMGKLESTGVLAGGIAHDFNNLLTAILLNLDLARFHQDSAEQMLPRVVAAEKAALAARSLTQQLITFARGGAAVPRITDIGALLTDSLPLVLSGSNVRSELTVDPDLWTAEVDAGQIGQVIRNLVLNAREAMPKGGVITLRAGNVSLLSAQVPGLAAGDYVQITVSDHGEGIPPEKLAKIFDPYFSTKQRGPQKGMGLGLTICHSVVQKHRGAITVESVQGQGTTFQVYLPAMQEKPPERQMSTPPWPDSAPVARRILVMDDEPIIRQTLELTLGKMGHQVETANNGPDALRAYRQAKESGEPFDLVLLDLTIPGGMGGRETLAALRTYDADVTAVVMSGYTDDKVMRDFAANGFKDALPKPFTTDMVNRVINAV